MTAAAGTVVLCATCRQQIVAGACPRCGAAAPQPPPPFEEPRSSRLRAGDVLEGKWRLEGKLGEGGMGTVFLAQDLALDRKVALKMLSRELCRDAQFLERFEREARLTAKLEHPNIVQVYAVGRHQGRPFMVMKWLDGRTLGCLLQSAGRFDPALTLFIFRQLCAGLGLVHSQGCVHRDVKASNVIVGPDGHATLLDFGVLRDLNAPGLTRAGTMLGTPRYMSPEQARGDTDVDHRADLYALGVLLFECLSGHPPFEAPSDLGVIHQHALAEPPDLSALEPSLPRALGPMLQRALAKAREGRYQSAAQFFAALEAAVATPGEPSTATAGDAPRPAPRTEAVADPLHFDPDAFGPIYAAVEAPPEPQPLPDPSVERPVAGPGPVPGPRRWAAPVLAAAGILIAGGVGALQWSAGHPPVHVPPAPTLDAAVPAPESPQPHVVPPVRPVSGWLKVTSSLSGKPYPASVEVDGVDRGETPVTLELPPGSHQVRVLREGFQHVERAVTVAPRQRTTLEVDLLP